jgi:hypothetical protein
VACETSRLARVMTLLDRNHATSKEVSLDVVYVKALMPYNYIQHKIIRPGTNNFCSKLCTGKNGVFDGEALWGPLC